MSGTRDLLARQLTVLRLCAVEGPQRFSTLRSRLGLPPSTAVRLLRGLQGVGLLRQLAQGYGLAPGATRLGLELLGHARPATAAEAAVTDLARQTGASAAFWLPDGEGLILAAKQEVPGGFRYIDRFAYRTLRESAFGVVIFAALPQAEQKRRLYRAPAFRRLVATVGADGVFAGTLPHEVDYWRVTAVVQNLDRVIGSVGISRHRMPAGAANARDRSCVAAAARRLARELGS